MGFKLISIFIIYLKLTSFRSPSYTHLSLLMFVSHLVNTLNTNSNIRMLRYTGEVL